ncbi:hypothetical protein B9Z55_026628 [Caenorhabditis nigoni]|uniref:Uncharacterized protein n=1 Tax=Caenorhabditis nigoni TaxID=1611254 RepID=A0A2G5T436_9PELO|nr:hypothetical protein B9Z55_026628 [Caenorhabditis nigoni]
MNPWRNTQSNTGWVSKNSMEYVNKSGAKEAVIGIPANTTVKITYYANKQRKRVGRSSRYSSRDSSDRQVCQNSQRTNSSPNKNQQNEESMRASRSRVHSNQNAAIPLYIPYIPPHFTMSSRSIDHLQQPYVHIREHPQTSRYAPYHLRFANRGSTQPAPTISRNHAPIVELPGLEIRYDEDNIRKFLNDTAPPKK